MIKSKYYNLSLDDLTMGQETLGDWFRCFENKISQHKLLAERSGIMGGKIDFMRIVISAEFHPIFQAKVDYEETLKND